MSLHLEMSGEVEGIYHYHGCDSHRTDESQAVPYVISRITHLVSAQVLMLYMISVRMSESVLRKYELDEYVKVNSAPKLTS